MSPPDLVSLAAIGDLAMRRAALGERLEHLEPGEAAGALERLVSRADTARAGRGAANLAFSTWLIRLHKYGGHSERERIRAGALEGGHETAAALLDDGPAHKAIAPLGRLPDTAMSETVNIPVNRLFHWLDISAGGVLRGTSKTRACLQVRSGWLEKAMAHPSPFFLRRLLRAHWLETQDVLGIASRRPTTPGLVYELATSDRWIGIPEVRAALAKNPFTPTGVVLALLPTVRTKTLSDLAEAGNAHALVCRGAGLLIAGDARAKRSSSR